MNFDRLSRIQKPAAILLGAAILTGLLMNFKFHLLDAKIYDTNMTWGQKPQPDSNIVLITIDEATIREASDYAPLSLNFHTRLLEQLLNYRPKAIGYLVNMQFVNQMDPDLFLGQSGQDFLKAANLLEKNQIPLLLGTPFDVNGEVLPPYPLSTLNHSIAVIHRDGNVFSGDNVSRRALLSIYQKPTFHRILAEKAGYTPADQIPRGAYQTTSVDTQYALFRYHDRTPGYTRISFWDVLMGKTHPQELAGKILLIGTLLRENPSDYTKTPFTPDGEGEAKLLIHADILDSLLHHQTLAIAPQWVVALVTLGCAALVLWWVMTLTPLYGVLATAGITSLVLVVNFFLFKGVQGAHGVWLPISSVLLAGILSYYLVVPFRLIREYRRRWNYQRQNEVLVQVEQLKRNFLSLVTHDLKTPVARVQGMAEVILNQAHERLNAQDRNHLKAIVNSTEELNRFITSILELSKAESSDLKLSLESKDINLLIEKTVENFVPQAHAKSIRFQTDLEPMFPLRFDPSLISKVLNNLVDNAIKYSPEQSTVRIESKEKGGNVEIKITDQGIGLSEEELSQLFTRFYRAKNQATINVHGSGLGLYLSKFFIEAHSGEITVESRSSVGSTFTIKLPIEPPVTSATPGLKTAFLSKLKPKESTHV